MSIIFNSTVNFGQAHSGACNTPRRNRQIEHSGANASRGTDSGCSRQQALPALEEARDWAHSGAPFDEAASTFRPAMAPNRKGKASNMN
jgi:hypothetical protein